MDDMDALFRLYEHPKITRFVEPLFSREKEMDYQRNYIRYIYGGYGYGMWIVEDRFNHSVIGRAGIEPHQEEPEDTVELGYIIAVDRQGQGLATEVCAAILHYAEAVLEKRRFYARVHPDNTPSRQLLFRLGFAESDEWVDGEQVFWKLSKR